jgi:nitroreductase
MEFLDLVTKRESVREYLSKPVERGKIERCLEAARYAPSTCNSQPWRFIVVDDRELARKVALETFGKMLSFNRFVLEAPVLVLVMSEKPNLPARIGAVVKNRQFNLIDVGIAAEHFCLQAVEEGLGTCMLGWFNEEGVKGLLSIPKGRRIDLVIAVGYPASPEIRPKKRKETAQIVSYNSYV